MTGHPTYDIFFSYARADNRNSGIERLVARIQEEYSRFFPDKKLHCFFDKQAIENGEDWRNRLYTGLKNSRMMISMLSENYLSSIWCRKEWQAWCEIERSRGWLSYMLCPIYYVEVPDSGRRIEDFLRQRDDFARQIQAFTMARAGESRENYEENECLAELSSRQIVDLKSWYDEGEESLRSEEIRRRIEELAHTIEAKVTLARNAEFTEGDFIRANRNFRGRIHELKLLRQSFSESEKGVVPVLHGLGGEGKTSLALAYAHAFAYDYPGGRFRVCSEGASTLKQCFVRLGEELGLDFAAGDSPGARYERVWNWLSGRPRGRCLVILDNIDVPEALSQDSLTGGVKPTDNVHVLAATRCSGKAVGPAGRPVPVTGLSSPDGLRLLESFRPITDEEKPQALLLVRQFGGHALSLELAGAFLRESPERDYAAFVKALDTSGALKSLELVRKSVGHQLNHEAVKQTQVELLVAPSLDPLTEEEMLALVLAAHMSPEFLSGSWLREALARLNPDSMRESELFSPWAMLRRKLTGLCLWQEDARPGIFRMHRLVREVILSRSSGAWKNHTPDDLTALLHDIATEAARAYADGRPTWPLHHFYAVAGTLANWLERGAQPQRYLELPKLLVETVLRGTGKTEDCEHLLTVAERAARSMPPGPSQDGLLAGLTLCRGHILMERGNAAEAAACFAAALTDYGGGHDAADREGVIRRACCLDYLGAALLACGEAADAVARHCLSVDLLEALLSRSADAHDEPAVQRELCYSLDHLAGALSRLPDGQGQEEGLALHRRSLGIRRTLVLREPGNVQLLRDLGVSLDRVGNGLLQAGLPEQADVLYEEGLKTALSLHEREPQSPVFRRDLSVSYNKRGDALLARQEYAAALALYRKALDVRMELVKEDPENRLFRYDLSQSHSKCGEALQADGNAAPALGHFLTALDGRRRLIREVPASARYRFGAALALEKAAEVRKAMGNNDAADADYGAAIDFVRELRDESLEGSSRRAACEGMLARLYAARSSEGGV